MISRTIHTHCRRALLNVPGNDMRKLEKAIGLSVDTIVLDLEDGVPLNKKDIARENIIQLVRNHGEMISKNKELVIRMNHINTKDGILDIEHCIRKCSNAINSIILPKVDQTKDLDMYYTALKNTSFKWLICIESPLAIINLKEITSLYLEKVDGLIFGAEDYCAASGITRTSSLKELHYPRSALVTTALAYGIDAIDLVTIDYKSVQALRDESLDGKQLGFTGKQAIHPDQIKVIQEIFQPSNESLELAKRIIQEYEYNIDFKGTGAFVLDGKVIDIPVVKWARKIISRNCNINN